MYISPSPGCSPVIAITGSTRQCCYCTRPSYLNVLRVSKLMGLLVGFAKCVKTASVIS